MPYKSWRLKRSATPIIAKLELPDAIQNLEEIIRAAEGVMVARGDLAVETSPATVPILQKRMIAAANRDDKIVITATQMLESMIQNPRPPGPRLPTSLMPSWTERMQSCFRQRARWASSRGKRSYDGFHRARGRGTFCRMGGDRFEER
jgi:hypothetical protein